MTMVDTVVWECVLGENEHCTATDPCFSCADRAHRARVAAGGCPDDCLECKTASLIIGAQVGIESRGRKFGELGFKETNSWERGVPTDDRGMPFIGSDGHVIGQKELSERRRQVTSAVRDNKAHLAAHAASTTGSN